MPSNVTERSSTPCSSSLAGSEARPITKRSLYLDLPDRTGNTTHLEFSVVEKPAEHPHCQSTFTPSLWDCGYFVNHEGEVELDRENATETFTLADGGTVTVAWVSTREQTEPGEELVEPADEGACQLQITPLGWNIGHHSTFGEWVWFSPSLPSSVADFEQSEVSTDAESGDEDGSVVVPMISSVKRDS
jgi:hypothetical protein